MNISVFEYAQQLKKLVKSRKTHIVYHSDDDVVLLGDGSIWRIGEVIDDWIYSPELEDEYPVYKLDFVRI